ncbi:hypothetical protein [Candidatus Pseudomonas adelgestsugas]|uniref:Uncharacterized protein n=1 Tax=Candidatus Pseudomonas adelgestsugas TaxID=1302376 RepID=A0ABX5R8A8_9PSED|nr:hypothetical protein C3B55_00545 [Candidatus Pseudomonas adelgestsugas]
MSYEIQVEGETSPKLLLVNDSATFTYVIASTISRRSFLIYAVGSTEENFIFARTDRPGYIVLNTLVLTNAMSVRHLWWEHIQRALTKNRIISLPSLLLMFWECASIFCSTSY